MTPLILGNSHTGCLLVASKQLGAEADTYAVPGGLGPDFEFVGDVVKKGKRHGTTPRSNISGALEAGVKFRDYDYIIYSTLGSADPQFVNKNHPLVQFARADMVMGDAEGLPLASRAFLETLIERFIRGMYATQSLQALSKSYDKQIFVQPVPLPLRAALDAEITPLQSLYGGNVEAVLSWYFRYQFKVLQEIVDELPEHVHLLPYPVSEALDVGFTPAELGVKENPWHMTSEYGSLVLKQVDERLGRSG